MHERGIQRGVEKWPPQRQEKPRVEIYTELARLLPVHMTKAPLTYLKSTQPFSDYKYEDEKLTKAKYKELGEEYVRKYPVISCVIPNVRHTPIDDIYPGHAYSWLIIDGHNRVRFGPLFGVRKFPAYVLSPQEGADLFKEPKIERFIHMMEARAQEAFRTFEMQPGFTEKFRGVPTSPVVFDRVSELSLEIAKHPSLPQETT